MTAAGWRRDATAAVVLFAAAAIVGWWSLQELKSAGAKPFFYQSNFEPAVLLACGKDFGLAQPAPPALTAFLAVAQDTLDCSAVADVSVSPLTTAAHANWYYMYAAAAGIWKIAGVSWSAIDLLVAGLVGLASVALFGLFRLVAPLWMSIAIVTLLTLSPSNLSAMLSLRDYSKAPFVLAAIWILGVLATRTMSLRSALLWSVAYGAVVGVGYGFRSDLIVMIPIGAIFVLLFLPELKTQYLRYCAAAAALLVTFAITASPVLTGLKYGGCQFHFALLGLTTPTQGELRLEPAAYRFGDHLTDSYVDLKVGDYAARMFSEPAPNLCDANYDRASGELYFALATTMPADFLVRAYASVLAILRVGLHVPEMVQPLPLFPRTDAARPIYAAVGAVTSRLAAIGPLLVLAAAIVAWYASPRLGLALIFLVLMLGGYPAVQFEARHWFHLRFLPWWAGALLATVALEALSADRRRLATATLSVLALIVAMAAILVGVRTVQQSSVRRLLAEYRAAATEALPLGPIEGSSIPVQWSGVDRGSTWQRRASDLLVVTLADANCGDGAPIAIRAQYAAARPEHDLSGDIRLATRSGGPNRVFLPVFRAGVNDTEYLRFRGLEISGAPPSCVASVARATDADRIPLWLTFVDVPGGVPFYETMRAPRLLNR